MQKKKFFMYNIAKKQYKYILAILLLSFALIYTFLLLFVTPKFEANTTIYVPNTHANIHLVSAGIRFGYDKEVGEHIEVLNSIQVKNNLIKQFKLDEHYGISKEHPYYIDKVYKEYDEHININRSINKSINISVLDENAKTAAEMANTLVKLADQHKSNIIKLNIKTAEKAARLHFNNRDSIHSIMSDSLESMRKSGESVWVYGQEKKSSKYQNYEIQYHKEMNEYYALRKRHEELDNLLKQEIPKSYVVSKAYIPSKPIYPKKGLISLLGSLVSGAIYLLIISIKEQKD